MFGVGGYLTLVSEGIEKYNICAKIKTQRVILHTDPVGSPGAEEDEKISRRKYAARL